MTGWRDVTFQVPDVTALTDDELRALFPYRDGRWSEVIAWGMLVLKATKLDLNGQWADTPQDWICPCCERSKAATLRVSTQGVLLAHLHEHHDHLQDVISRALQSKVAHPWVKHVPSGTAHLQTLGSRMLARFQPALVCADCNGAEASAKAKLRQVHRDFSFRPSEVAAFITVAPNTDHVVDLEKAAAIWETEEQDFLERLKLADLLIEAILSGQMTQERARWREPLTEYDRHVRYWFARSDSVRGVLDDLSALERRSLAREGVGAQAEIASPRERRPGKPPTDAEVEAHDGGAYPLLWARLDAGWRCPSCNRDRKSLVRRSKKQGRRWSGGVRKHDEYIFHAADAEEWADLDTPMVTHHERHLICEDCNNIGPQLRQRDPLMKDVPFILQLDDIRAVVTATPHAPHQIDWDCLRDKIGTGETRLEPIGEYQKYLAEAVGARRTYHYFLKLTPDDHRTAWRRTIAHRTDLGDSAEEIDGNLALLIEAADRLEPLES